MSVPKLDTKTALTPVAKIASNIDKKGLPRRFLIPSVKLPGAKTIQPAISWALKTAFSPATIKADTDA
jgi:hypothetical protein